MTDEMTYPVLDSETRPYLDGISPEKFVSDCIKEGVLLLDWNKKHQLGVLVVGIRGLHHQNRAGIIAVFGREFALNCDRVARRIGCKNDKPR